MEGKIYTTHDCQLSELGKAITAFIEYYNYRRYHEGLGAYIPHHGDAGLRPALNDRPLVL